MGYSRRKNYWKSNYGAESAARHIQEAEEFSKEVGGTDKDVKAYFFSIAGDDKEEILTLYGHQYGAKKEEYARQTWHSWASGRRKMSGLVAKRLFSLLPEYMPVGAKLNMVESLWKHCSPSSRTTIKIDSRSESGSVISKVRTHFEDKMSHEIPDNFTRRFEWLSGDDSKVKQQLLNHFRNLELGVVSSSLEPKIEVLRERMRMNSSLYLSGTHTVSIGNHDLILSFDNSEAIEAEKIRKRDLSRKKLAKTMNESLLIITIVIVVVIIMAAVVTS